MRRLLRRTLTTTSRNSAKRPSYGFSGAGFLGCYHVGVAACLHKHGHLPAPDDDSSSTQTPLLTGVSAGSMTASAIRAGVHLEREGMEVVLEAARRTRELAKQEGAGVSLDVFTPGFSLIDQVEGPFREAMAKALGGHCTTDESGTAIVCDVDPELFARRFPEGALRIGLAEWRDLSPLRPGEAYRYVDAYRDLEDVVACSMLSSYVPGVTGALDLQDKLPGSLAGAIPLDSMGTSRASVRAGRRLKEMTQLGMVKHGATGEPTVKEAPQSKQDKESDEDADNGVEPSCYWDGGISDMFPTFDEDTVVVSPLNGIYDPNPAISPELPQIEFDATAATENERDPKSQSNQLQRPLLQNFLWRFLPSTFRHCRKSELGLNTKNATAALKMIFSSDDDELYERFRDGYDDASRFLDERGQLRVISR